MRTIRLVASFEGLNSSLAQSPGELWSCKDLPIYSFWSENRLAAEVLNQPKECIGILKFKQPDMKTINEALYDIDHGCATMQHCQDKCT